MLAIKYTSKMKRDVKRVAKQGKDINKLISTLSALATGKPMPPEYRDHQLKGNLSDFRECHVDGEGDWLLLYQITDGGLTICACGTGTHSELLGG